MTEKVACTHPGKIGDTIYALPTVRKIAGILKTKSDFYTSEYCRPLKRLFEYQNCINRFYMPDSYVIERMDMGVQPWRVPVDLTQYDRVYHMGFRWVPDKAIPDFICESIGMAPPVEIKYEYPDFETINGPYIIVAPRGETSYKETFKGVIESSPIPAVVVGGVGDYIGVGIDQTGVDFLETTTWIAKSVGYVGLMSSQLAIANGFNIPKIAPHDGIHWDMRHVVYSPTNFYPVNPTPLEILRILNV